MIISFSGLWMTFNDRYLQIQGSFKISPIDTLFSKFFSSIFAIKFLAYPERVFQMGLAKFKGSLRILWMIVSCYLPTNGALPDNSTNKRMPKDQISHLLL